MTYEPTVTHTDLAPRRRVGHLLRRVAGIILAVATALGAVGFVLGATNPWHLVFLTEWFRNWPLGCLLVAIGGFVSSWLLTPVRHEAVQGRRIVLRIVFAVATVASLLCWGIVGTSFARTSSVLARSEDGQRAVALVVHSVDDQQLRIWVGTGLGTRDVGLIGPACGAIRASFVSPTDVLVESVYGNFHATLDATTGAPVTGRASCDG